MNFELGRFGIGNLDPTARAAAISALMRRLLRVMPTDQNAILVAACNTALEDISMALQFAGPRVEAVYPGDGSVTMRQG